MPDASLEKFQDLLRELFQLDCQGLDFGIYRVLNLKRGEIQKFIEESLPRIVNEAFAEYASADQREVEREVEQKRKEIEETAAKLGEQAFEPNGQLVLKISESPLGKEFLKLEKKAKVGRVAGDLKASVYNDLYAFFSRYYDDGDIFSKPRRGRVEIPFTGHEDVVLYWANKDQYYIKTGEQFKSYRFSANSPGGPPFVEFKLNNVAVEQNNNRSETRYYVLAAKSPLNWDDAAKTLSIFFEYRPLIEGEKQTYGKTETQKPQEKLNEHAGERVFKSSAAKLAPELKARLAQSLGEDKPSLLRQHLTRFTRKNTTDFFIHKNLRGFLTGEMDDFIKTEVLRTGELLAPDRSVAERQLARARVVRTIAEKLIAFLAQIEDFQKKLFEKRKFVVRTEYCATLDRVPEELWNTVLRNKEQIAEWQQLYALDDLLKAAKKKKLDRDFLRAHDKLLIDTRHFDEEFKWQLLAKIDNLDDALDGLLIKSENFQALALLLAKYRERVRCIYIDPPYNTGVDEFLYKDAYQHSSWLAMLGTCVPIARDFVNATGLFFSSIDFVEVSRFRLLLDQVFGAENFLADVAWEKRYTRSNNAKLFYSLKDTILAYRGSPHLTLLREARTEKADANYSNPDNDPRGPWISSSYVNPATKEKRQNLVYSIKNPYTKKKVTHPTHAWKYEYDVHLEHVREKRLYWGARGEYTYPRLKSFLADMTGGLVPVDVWRYTDSGSTDEGGNELKALFGSQVFDNPKPTRLIRRMLDLAKAPDELVVLDFFGGSGSTAHATIQLNREDLANRNYIMVEVGGWFDTVMLPRIKKVAFCEDWKEGKPTGGKGISQLVKYHVLEQYEDALNNLELPRAAEGELALKQFGDEYLLRYMLEFETAGSASLLSLQQMQHPFRYKLKVQEGDAAVERVVDLVETFNYLLGLKVKKLRQFRDGERLYRVALGEQRNQKSAVVIWRDLEGLEQDANALRHDAEFIETKILPELSGKTTKPDRVLVNGPCGIKGAEAIEPEFRRLMFAPIA